MHYTERIRGAREDRDLKQEDIAKVLKITRKQYQLYESGKREMKVSQFKKLCEFYKISADYLLGISQYQEKAEFVKVAIFDLKVLCAQ